MQQRMGLALTVILFAAAPAAAQVQPQPQVQPTQPKTSESDPVVCEKQEEIGTRLATHKVCHTRSQWQQLRLGDRSATERVQTQRTMDQNGH